MSSCRICFDGEEAGPLVKSICACVGVASHDHCMRRWHDAKVASDGMTTGLCAVCRKPEAEPVFGNFDPLAAMSSLTIANLERLEAYAKLSGKAAEILNAGFLAVANGIPFEKKAERMKALSVAVSIVEEGSAHEMTLRQNAVSVALFDSRALGTLIKLHRKDREELTLKVMISRVAIEVNDVHYSPHIVNKEGALVCALFCMNLLFKLLEAKPASKRTQRGLRVLYNAVINKSRMFLLFHELRETAAELILLLFENAGCNFWAAQPKLAKSTMLCSIRAAAHACGCASVAQLIATGPQSDPPVEMKAVQAVLGLAPRTRAGRSARRMCAAELVGANVAMVNTSSPLWRELLLAADLPYL